MLVTLLAAALALTAASVLVKPSKARSFDLFAGSLFLNDNTSPVAVDLASGKPTVRLSNAFTAVSARRSGDLDMLPLATATLMLNPGTGEFNMVDQSDFVVKPAGGGVALPRLPGASGTSAVPSGDSAYLVQRADDRTAVYLVGQSTVASAVGPAARAKPRAAGVLRQSVRPAPGAVASANGALWLLAGRGTDQSLVRFSVPNGSNAGARLATARRGTVAGVAALASATRAPDGTGTDVLAVASADSVTLYQGTGAPQRLTIPPVAGLQQILPASNSAGVVQFLYRARNGWSIVSAAADGSGGAVVARLSGIDGTSTLVPPAQSGGLLYTTASNGSGRLWQIDRAGGVQPIDGAGRYPLLPQEPLDQQDIQVQARGSRVVFNARGNFQALVVFSDGSQPPRVIDKHSAVQIDAGGAASLRVGSEQKRAAKPDRPGKTTKPKPKAVPPKRNTPPKQSVSDKVNCKTTTQRPHIPTVQLVERGSRSVQLRWNYPLLDPQDCAASTYTVSVKLLNGADAPPPPATLTVQGQDGVNLVGLFPDSQYELVVTAYINGIGTPSAPLPVRTSVEGPPAPTGVTAAVDASGNWTIAWNSCGGKPTGCVPTASWQVIPRFCDGLGLANPPATRQLAGDPSQHGFALTYPGSATLLGRGLSFQVEGIGAQGTIGTPSAQSSCETSWTPPVRANISVRASAPAVITGSTTRTTVSVAFAGGQTHDLGGVGGTLRYELLSDGSVIDSLGPTSRTTATLSGIRPGQRYQVAVTATAPGHPNATARIGPVAVEPAIARWPDPSVAASFATTGASTGALSLRVSFPSGTDSRGETFDLVDSRLVCGNSARELSYSNFTPGSVLRFADISRVQFNSQGNPCRVEVRLQQNAGQHTDPPLYGAGRSSSASTSVQIAVPTFTGSKDDFTAAWASRDAQHPEVQVSYRDSDPLLTTYATNWKLQVANSAMANCGTVTSRPPASISIESDCVTQGGTFTVTVSFSYFGSTRSYVVAVQGDAPKPIQFSQMRFSAQWSPGSAASARGFVIVSYADGRVYDQDTLDGLEWTFTVTSDATPDVTCASSDSPPQADGSGPSLQVDFTACPPGGDATTTPPKPPATYTLVVHVADPTSGQHDFSAPVNGELLP